MFELHATVYADARARLSAGNRMPISTAMMPMTTSNSTRVNPDRLRSADFERVSAVMAVRPSHRAGARRQMRCGRSPPFNKMYYARHGIAFHPENLPRWPVTCKNNTYLRKSYPQISLWGL